MTTFATFSTKALQCVAGILSGKTPTRSESRANAQKRVERLLDAEADRQRTLENLPSLLRSRGFAEEAAKLEDATGTHEADETLESEPRPEPEPVGVESEEFAAQAMAAAERAMAEAAEAQDALPEPAPAQPRRARKAATPREPKAGPQYPKEGTKARLVLDMMRRDGGVLNSAICEAVGFRCSFAINGRKAAQHYGLVFRQEREGREMRFWLRDREEGE